MKLTKDKAIEKEYKRISKLFEGMPENKRQLTEKLIRNCAFMAVTLEELQALVNEEGAVVYSTNGNGFETRSEHPAQKSYNTMIKNFNATIKQLNDLMPEKQNVSKLAELMSE